MKTILKTKFLYVFFLLSLAVSFNGCSSDDDDITSQTFLEKYDGTKWINTESLDDFLDPADPLKTVEGYPAPVRVVITAKAY